MISGGKIILEGTKGGVRLLASLALFYTLFIYPTLRSAFASELEEVCGSVIDIGDCSIKKNDGATGNVGMKAEYCVAACQGDGAVTDSIVKSALWGASAATCLMACTPTGIVTGKVCEIGFLGVTGLDIAYNFLISKQGEGAVQSLISGVLGVGLTSGLPALFDKKEVAPPETLKPGKSVDNALQDESNKKIANDQVKEKVAEVTKAKKEWDLSSCVRFASAVIQTGMAIARIGPSNTLKDGNLSQARNLGNEFDSSGAEKKKTSTGQNLAAGEKKKAEQKAPVYGDTCWERFRAGIITNANQCMKDKDQYQAATDDSYRDAIKNLSNQTLDDLIRNLLNKPTASAGDALNQALGGTSLDPSQVAKSVQDFMKGVPTELVASYERGQGDFYKGGGRRSDTTASGDSGASDFQSIMKTMMSQMMPNQEGGGETQNSTNESPQYAQLKTKSAEEIEKDTAISLFTRVEFRYRNSMTKVESIPYVLPFNQGARFPASK